MVDIVKVFGSSASVDSSSPTSPILSIHWADLKNSLEGSGSSPGATGEDWLAAILYYSLDSLSPLAQSDRLVSLTPLSTSLSLWNNFRQRTYGLQVSFYELDDGASRPSSVNL